MGNKAVKQHFETAQKTGVLKISQMRLQEFPSPLKTFPNVLKTLDISENRFTSLPPDLGKFTLVKSLNVSGNRIEALPEVLGLLIKLETLNACNNLLRHISPALGKLKNLKQVNLSNNQLSEFPTMFCGLENLDMLDVSRNKITCVPPEVRDFHGIELNLNQNQVATLSDELASCKRLKTLRLEENCLQITAITPRILKESVICNLALDGNLFSSKQFTDLDGYDTYMERYTAVKKKMF
ncbi:leucine-rich repeat-containing protein 57 [Lutzomyia longipalpis]|uniref:leucine-rich repeat-containing protein 57 n=1 Tax=Lutzomyia longipalpis TaxID=7200 RepID=UPI002483F779|nr:leucine-rich repeat-containing protein 57 [Lutzomyia longipalpis]